MSISKNDKVSSEIIPSNYNIIFDTNIKKFTYSGNERISAKVIKQTKIIKIGAQEIKIRSAKIRDKNGIQTAHIKNDLKNKSISLNVNRSVFGNILIEIEFEGINNNKMYGFYRSEYTINGKKRYMLSTQFEPASALSAFPCFDSPSLKATFDITLIVDANLDAISNMPIKSETHTNNSRKLVRFYTTPHMSTYLLYLGVGKFEYLEDQLGKLKIRGVTIPGKINLIKLGMDYTKLFIKYFEKYFGIKYPLPKLDIIAVPDFAMGAMENWGAITFREGRFLADSKNAPNELKMGVAEVIAHELAHQWFGNLVTMKWWDDLWLNESFATFMSYKAIGAVFPEWEVDNLYLEEVVIKAFMADGVKATHPISVNVDTPEQINQMFDEISYEKGGTVLHMLEAYIGKEVFRKGLHNYLKKYAYSNATKSDLWNSISAIAPKEKKESFKNITKCWIETKGYPIINVSYKNKSFLLEQNRFMISNTNRNTQLWYIPLQYQTQDIKFGNSLMKSKQIKIKTKSDWIKLNLNQDYLYHVGYPSDMYDKLGEMIKNKKIGWKDAWGIENDIFIMTRKGNIKLNRYMDFIEKYCMDAKFPLDISISSHLNWLYTILYGTRRFEHFSIQSKIFFTNQINKLGWNAKGSDSSSDPDMRRISIGSLAVLGDKPTIKKAISLFKKIYSGTKIDPNITPAIYNIAAMYGDIHTYKQITSLYKTIKLPHEKIMILKSFGMFKDKKLAKKALDMSLSDDVRYQDSIFIPTSMRNNPVSRIHRTQSYMPANPEISEIFLEWIFKNWNLLLKTFPPSSITLKQYVSLLSIEKDKNARAKIKRFFDKKKNRRDDISNIIAISLENIDSNIHFMQANKLLE